jgi:hypothetical protein
VGRGINYRKYQLTLTEHAWERLLQYSSFRGKRKSAQSHLERQLNAQMREGMRLDKTGAAWLEVNSELWAVVRLSGGAWVCTTIINYGQDRAVM